MIPKSQGFTLVELSIVVTIIGLLIGAVMKGQEMIQQGNVTATISLIRSVSAANRTFYDVYKALPGDMGDARTRLRGCTVANSCHNGDDNSLIGVTRDQPWQDTDAGIATENTQFWKHLALAKMFKGIDSSASVPRWDDTHPSTPIGGGLHMCSTWAGTQTAQGSITVYAPLMGNMMLLRKSVSGGTDSFAGLSPRDASIVDLKMDDGVALEGRVHAVSHDLTTGCGARNAGINGPMGYAENSTAMTCDLMMKFE